MSFPKLNECLSNKEQNQYKKISVIHALKNSLARNTIAQSPTKIGSDNKINASKYQQRISADEFTDDDLTKLLKHLFSKQNYNLNDRNFIRRILLKQFSQQMICAGGRDFIKFLKFQILHKNQYIQPREESKNFYLVLKGKVNIRTNNYQYKKSSKQYFGQFQILGNQYISQIKAKSDSLLLTLRQQHFKSFFSNYFITKYQILRKRNISIQNILNLTSNYNQLWILSKMYQVSFKTGQKILQKDQPITNIVFLDKTLISSSDNKLLNQYKAVGLTQFIQMNQPISKQTIYCMQNKNAYSIKVEDFQQLISKQVLMDYFQSYFLSSKLSNQKKKNLLLCKSYKIQNFVRVKTVKFNQKSRVLTEANSNTSPNKKSVNNPEFITSFVFLKQMNNKFNKNKNKIINNSKVMDINLKDSFRNKTWLDDFEKQKYYNEQLLMNTIQKQRMNLSQKL